MRTLKIEIHLDPDDDAAQVIKEVRSALHELSSSTSAAVAIDEVSAEPLKATPPPALPETSNDGYLAQLADVAKTMNNRQATFLNMLSEDLELTPEEVVDAGFAKAAKSIPAFLACLSRKIMNAGLSVPYESVVVRGERTYRWVVR